MRSSQFDMKNIQPELDKFIPMVHILQKKIAKFRNINVVKFYELRKTYSFLFPAIGY